jgi:hypothetical protein
MAGPFIALRSTFPIPGDATARQIAQLVARAVARLAMKSGNDQHLLAAHLDEGAQLALYIGELLFFVIAQHEAEPAGNPLTVVAAGASANTIGRRGLVVIHSPEQRPCFTLETPLKRGAIRRPRGHCRGQTPYTATRKAV